MILLQGIKKEKSVQLSIQVFVYPDKTELVVDERAILRIMGKARFFNEKQNCITSLAGFPFLECFCSVFGDGRKPAEGLCFDSSPSAFRE
jgi:hypothetical protein